MHCCKNSILLEEGTLIEPNQEGHALFDIDPGLTVPNNCGFLPIVTEEHGTSNRSKTSEDIPLYRVYPTKVKTLMTIIPEKETTQALSKVVLYDTFNRQVFSQKEFQDRNMELNLSHLKPGIYIVKGYTATGDIVLTEKIIKN